MDKQADDGIHNTLCNIGLALNADLCVYFKSNNKLILVLLYVDNMLASKGGATN